MWLTFFCGVLVSVSQVNVIVTNKLSLAEITLVLSQAWYRGMHINICYASDLIKPIAGHTCIYTSNLVYPCVPTR